MRTMLFNIRHFLVDVIPQIQSTRHHHRLPFEEMGNVLLEAMQGTLICLDNHHIIVDVSPTVKRYFGFEQVCSVRIDFSF